MSSPSVSEAPSYAGELSRNLSITGDRGVRFPLSIFTGVGLPSGAVSKMDNRV